MDFKVEYKYLLNELINIKKIIYSRHGSGRRSYITRLFSTLGNAINRGKLIEQALLQVAQTQPENSSSNWTVETALQQANLLLSEAAGNIAVAKDLAILHKLRLTESLQVIRELVKTSKDKKSK